MHVRGSGSRICINARSSDSQEPFVVCPEFNSGVDRCIDGSLRLMQAIVLLAPFGCLLVHGWNRLTSTHVFSVRLRHVNPSTVNETVCWHPCQPLRREARPIHATANPGQAWSAQCPSAPNQNQCCRLHNWIQSWIIRGVFARRDALRCQINTFLGQRTV